MSILGAYEALIYTSSGVDKDTGNATNVGVVTRINPILDPGNLEIEGTGERGLYDVLLGMREVQFSVDILFTDETFISVYQTGLVAIPWLHLRFKSGAGLTFENAYMNRVTVESRHGQAISASIEFWADDVSALGSPSWQAAQTTPFRWSDSELFISGGVAQTQWWSWRYEIVNNLQRLGNVADGGTRSIRARHRRVTGLIIIDLITFAEYLALVNYASEPAKFNITIHIKPVSPGGTDLINNNCRWGRLETPAGPEDLIARRFPFVALDIS